MWYWFQLECALAWETGGATLPHLSRHYRFSGQNSPEFGPGSSQNPAESCCTNLCSGCKQLPVPDAANLLEFFNIHDANTAIAKLDETLALEIAQDRADGLTIGAKPVG